MKFKVAAAIAAITLSGGQASATTVLSSALKNLNDSEAGNIAKTTTNATGKRTTVTGTANVTFSMVIVPDIWMQSSIGAGSTVGITTDYARSGNGSAYFNSTQGETGKGNLSYVMGADTPLSGLTRISYDYYRDSASTTTANLAPVLRLQIKKDETYVGTLVFEPFYQTQQQAALNSWTTMTADLNNGLFWATNPKLGPTQATAGGLKTLSQWMQANSDGQLKVRGIEVGIGSGWKGTFFGAVDNVDVKFGSQRTINANFEVVSVAGAVPEPATWAMMVTGFGAIGFGMRRRKRTPDATSVAC